MIAGAGSGPHARSVTSNYPDHEPGKSAENRARFMILEQQE